MKKRGKRKKEGAEKIVFQVADESSKAEDDADEREIEPEKAKNVEAQRELDQNNNNKQEELPKKQEWAVNEVNERAWGGRRSNIEDTQETPGDKVMTTSAEKDKLLKERKKESTLRLSLFPNMPLFLNFVTNNSLPGIRMRSQSEGLKNMGWNMVAPRGKIPASDINQKEDCARLQHILGDTVFVHEYSLWRDNRTPFRRKCLQRPYLGLLR